MRQTLYIHKIEIFDYWEIKVQIRKIFIFNIQHTSNTSLLTREPIKNKAKLFFSLNYLINIGLIP